MSKRKQFRAKTRPIVLAAKNNYNMKLYKRNLCRHRLGGYRWVSSLCRAARIIICAATSGGTWSVLIAR